MGSIGCCLVSVEEDSGTDEPDVLFCRTSSFLIMISLSLQLGMLAYSLGLKDEAAFLYHLIVDLESIQNRIVAV